MRRLIITGAAGFVGRACISPLQEMDYEIHAVDRQPCPDFLNSVIWHSCNLLDPAERRDLISSVQPSHLLHLAWCTDHGHFWNMKENYDWLEASIDLMRLFYDAAGCRFVGVGSCAEYDWNYGYCQESITPLQPRTIYGVCKHAFHQLLQSYPKTEAQGYGWARLFFLYGPYENPSRLIAFVIRNILENQPVLCTHANQIRDYIHVHDAARLLAELVSYPKNGAFNIATGNPVRLRDMIEYIADQLKRKELIQLGMIPTKADEPPLIVGAMENYKMQIGPISSFPMDEGLNRTIEWWKTHLGKIS